MKQRPGLRVAAILIGVLAGCLILELFSTAWLGLENGGYVSAKALFDRTPNSFLGAGTRNSGCTAADSLFPHPYVAFVHHGDPPCGSNNTNNVGYIYLL